MKGKFFKLSHFIGVAIFLLACSHANACQSIDDLYSNDGCYVSAKESRHAQTGRVHVKIYDDGSGSRDLSKLMHIVGPFDVPQSKPFGLTLMQKELDLVKRSGINIVYYDYSEYNDNYLQNKGLALKAAMKKIDELRGETRASVMLGLSMGGVVARYALATLEKENYRHGVTHYISYDSPHSGAHIPVALQYIPRFMRNAGQRALNDNKKSVSFVTQLARLVDLISFDSITIDGVDLSHIALNGEKNAVNTISTAQALLSQQKDSQASKQMLIKNIYASSASGARDPAGEALLAELEVLGFPKGVGLDIQNIALVQGSISGKKLAYTNKMYFDFNSNYNSNDGVHRLNIKSYVLGASVYSENSSSNGSTPPGCYSASCVDFSKTTYGHYLFDAGLQYTDISEKFIGGGKDWHEEFYRIPAFSKSSNHLKDDIQSCSTLPLPQLIAQVLNIELQNLNLTDNGDFKALQEVSCFIPAYSALGKSSKYALLSPFHTYYGSDSNKPHDSFDAARLWEQGTGNSFEYDFLNTILPSSYVKNKSWSFKNPTSTTSSGSSGTSYTIYNASSQEACYRSWGYTGRVMRWSAPNKCYVRKS